MSICDSNVFVIGMQLHEFRILCVVFSAQNKQTLVKDDVHSGAHARTAIFVKYDILTEYLTLFWFAILVNEYKQQYV